MGGRPLVEPVYTDVSVTSAGGQASMATLVVTGHLPGQPNVAVTTTYSLAPGERMLEVRTRVQNNTNAMLPGFTLADRLYQGRSQRFVPGPGLWPAGRTSSAHWEAFFADGYVWGLLGPVLAPMEGVHEAGSSLLTYSSTDLEAGHEREYRRYLLAEYRRAGEGLAGGGPCARGPAWHRPRGAAGAGRRRAGAGRLPPGAAA